jgi:pimeloyl-ACP methyl ester carboxylesterase
METDAGNLKQAWTILDGLPLFYRTNASPVPPAARTIVHIHGFGISGTYLVPTAVRLAGAYATWVPDLPGFGKSHHPPHTLTIDQLGDAVVRFMDQQGIDKAVLLGNSLGCPIIASVLDAHRDRIDTMVMVSPAGGRSNRPIVKGVAQLAVAGMREPWGMVPIGARDYLSYGLVQTLGLLRSMIEYPLHERIAEMVIPLLVVRGSRDPLVSEERVEELATILPSMTAVVIEGAAHAINYSHPDQLAHVVRSYLEGTPIDDDPRFKGRVRLIHRPPERPPAAP